MDIAVAAAREALNGPWKLASPTERAQYLFKLVTLMEQSLEILAAVESMDNGKDINSSRGDIAGTIGCLRYYAGWADKIEGRVINTNPKSLNYTKREPVTTFFFFLSLLVYIQLIHETRSVYVVK